MGLGIVSCTLPDFCSARDLFCDDSRESLLTGQTVVFRVLLLVIENEFAFVFGGQYSDTTTLLSVQYSIRHSFVYVSRYLLCISLRYYSFVFGFEGLISISKNKRLLKTTGRLFCAFFISFITHFISFLWIAHQCSALPDLYSTDLLYDCIQSVCDIIELWCLLVYTGSRVHNKISCSRMHKDIIGRGYIFKFICIHFNWNDNETIQRI